MNTYNQPVKHTNLFYFVFYLTFPLFLYLGTQNSNFFTIKENNISTPSDHPSTTHIPNNQKNPYLSPFARSQSFNNYNRYRTNLQNERLYVSSKVEPDSCPSYCKGGQYNPLETGGTNFWALWGQQQQNVPISTHHIQNNVNTNTNTHSSSSKLLLNNTHYQTSPVRRSDSFSPGNCTCMPYVNMCYRFIILGNN